MSLYIIHFSHPSIRLSTHADNISCLTIEESHLVSGASSSSAGHPSRVLADWLDDNLMDGAEEPSKFCSPIIKEERSGKNWQTQDTVFILATTIERLLMTRIYNVPFNGALDDVRLERPAASQPANEPTTLKEYAGEEEQLPKYW